MPTDLDNAKLMFLCLKFSTATAFDYKKIGDECNISAGAASKRMSRLKQAVKEGKENGLDVRYLWSCIQHSDMNNVDFKAVGEELSLNTGAASKRWSRLKKALENGETGSTAAAAPGGKQGSSSNGKKGAASNRKRQNAETAADNEEYDTSAFKKAKRNPSTRKVKTEEHNDDDGNDAAETYESDDTAEGIVIPGLDKKPTTIVKKSAPALSQMVAATTGGPVKTSTITFTAAPDSPRSPASAPPRGRRGRRPLTDEEVYRKLNVDEAEEHARRSMGGATSRAYPKSHNLRDTFAAMRTPDGKQGGATANAFDDVAIPGENDDADDSSVTPSRYSTPNNSNSASPPKQQKKKPTVNEVFAAIADEAMKSPSGAEERQRMKQIKAVEKESNSGSKSRVATPTNPMTPAAATFAANNTDDANQLPLAHSVNVGNKGGGRLSGGSAGGNDDWYRVPQNLPNPFFGPPLGESLGDDESSFFKNAMGDGEEYV